MRRENKRVEFRKSKNLKFWTFRILKIINDRSLSTALKPMIQIHSEKSLILIFFEQLNRAGNSSRKIIIILMSNNIFRQIIESIFHGPRINEHLAQWTVVTVLLTITVRGGSVLPKHFIMAFSMLIG